MADAIFSAGWDTSLPTITSLNGTVSAGASVSAGWDTSLPLIVSMSGDAETPIEVSAGFTTVTLTSFNGSVTVVNGTRCFISAQHKLAVRITPMVGADTLFAANPDPVDAASSGEFNSSEEGVE